MFVVYALGLLMYSGPLLHVKMLPERLGFARKKKTNSFSRFDNNLFERMDSPGNYEEYPSVFVQLPEDLDSILLPAGPELYFLR